MFSIARSCGAHSIPQHHGFVGIAVPKRLERSVGIYSFRKNSISSVDNFDGLKTGTYVCT